MRVAGRHLIRRALGAGGMGSVHLAEDSWRGGRLVALKSAPLAEEAARQGLEREFGWLCRLRHPNVVAVHDFGRCETTRRAWFTMEHAEGRSFLEALAGRSFQDQSRVVIQLCRAIDFLHSRGLVHADLKAENVIVREAASGELQVTLVDFGLAADPEELERRAAGRFSGTLSHAAPELVGGEGRPGPGTDLYALGVLLFELHAGRRLFEQVDPVAQAEAHRKQEPPDLAEACPDLGPACRASLAKLLAKAPSARPPSALAVATAWADEAGVELEAGQLDSLLAHVRAPRLIGQDATLARALDLAAVAADRGAGGVRALRIEGPPGSGKSRVLDEAAQRAQLEGVRVLRGRAGGSGDPMAGLAEPVREAARLAGAAAEPLLPELVKISGPLARETGVEPSTPLSPDDERLRLGAAIWDLLVAAAVRPLLVVIDDGEHLLPEAEALLAYLLRRLAFAQRDGERPGIAFLVAGRGEAAGGSSREFERHGGSAHTSLLDEVATGALLEALFPGLQDREELAALFQRELGGSAALTERWAASLVREGALTRQARGWSVASDHEALRSPPQGLADAVAEQLARLGRTSQELLADVGVLPDGVSAAVLAKLGGRDEAAQEDELDELEGMDLVVAPRTELGRSVQVFSGLVRESIAENLHELQRERAGLLLDAAADELDDAQLARLAETAERLDEALAAWRRALELARERADHARAHGAARRLAALSSGAERGRALRAAAGEALELERYEEAEELVTEAGGEPTDGLADELERLDTEVNVAARTGRLAEAAALATRRLELTPGDAPDRWEAVSGLLSSRARDGSSDWEQLADELKQLSGDDPARVAQHHMHVAVAQLTRNHDAEAVVALRKALRGSLSLPRQAAAHNNLGVAELRARNLPGAAKALRRAAEIRREIGARVALSGTLVNLSLIDLELARPAAAVRRLRESLAIKREAGDRAGTMLCLTNLAVAEFNRQELSAVLRYAEETRSESADVTAGRAGAVVNMLEFDVLVQVGDREGAARALERLGPVEEDEGFQAHLPHLTMARARQEVAEGLREEASQRLAALAELPSLGEVDRLEVALARAELMTRAPDSRRRPQGPALGHRSAAEQALLCLPREVDSAATPLPILLQLHLARAAVWDALGRPARVRAELEAAASHERGLPDRLVLVELDAARGLAAARRGDWAGSAAQYESALRRVRAVARRLPPEHRDGFLSQARQAGLREALLAVREAAVSDQAQRGFFAPLAGASGSASAERSEAPELRRRVNEIGREARRLREVIEITRDINALLPVGQLLDRILSRVLGLLNAERGFIVLGSGGAESEFAAARDSSGRPVERAEFAVSRSVLDEVMRTGEAVLSSDARADERFVSKQSVLLLDLRSVLVAPLVAHDEVIGALYVDNSQRAGAFSERDLELLNLFAGQAAVAVENARLHETRIAKDLLDQEISIARGIQERLIPKILPSMTGFRLAASMRPAREVGGDYYDCLELPDGRLRIALGDVSGKGIPAGLVMVMAHSILREVGLADEGLDRILERANGALESRIEDDKFMTLLLMEPEPCGRAVKLSLAGHEPPLLWRSRDGSVEVLEAGGLALGMLPDLAGMLREDRVVLEAGDLLCCYTDGVTECRAPDGSMFGRERLVAALAANARGNAAEVRAALEDELDAFRAGGERSDDLTLLILETVEEEGADR